VNNQKTSRTFPISNSVDPQNSAPYEKITTDVSKLTSQDITEINQRIAKGKGTDQDKLIFGQLMREALKEQSQNLNVLVGGGASQNNIAIANQVAIQKMADKWGVEITVVGSRAKGGAHRESDWDYIVNGEITSKMMRDLRNNLPKSPVSSAEMGRERLEIFKQSSHPLRESEPYIKFIPKKIKKYYERNNF
jgi:predicted nucleotidyltransferase